jgi:hypothetical protein
LLDSIHSAVAVAGAAGGQPDASEVCVDTWLHTMVFQSIGRDGLTLDDAAVVGGGGMSELFRDARGASCTVGGSDSNTISSESTFTTSASPGVHVGANGDAQRSLIQVLTHAQNDDAADYVNALAIASLAAEARWQLLCEEGCNRGNQGEWGERKGGGVGGVGGSAEVIRAAVLHQSTQLAAIIVAAVLDTVREHAAASGGGGVGGAGSNDGREEAAVRCSLSNSN